MAATSAPVIRDLSAELAFLSTAAKAATMCEARDRLTDVLAKNRGP